MIRTVVLAFLMLGSLGRASYAIQTLTEDFGSPTLNSQLYITSTSPSYSVEPLTPGATWQMSKQAGPTTGSIEITTQFKLTGNFVAELTVDASLIGTGEVGMRFGERLAIPRSEVFFNAPREGESIDYAVGGYGIAGFGTGTNFTTLKMIRSGDEIDNYVNGFLFSISQFSPNSFREPEPISIFLRPFSGTGFFDPTAGNPDAHFATLDHFTVTAVSFVPEPTTLTLTVAALALCRTRRRRNHTLTTQ